jgi:hypothetical protein
MDEDVIISFPEWPVNLFDVDCTGNWAALAVYVNLIASINLNNPITS